MDENRKETADALAALGRPPEKDRLEARLEIPADLTIRVNRLLFQQLLIHLLMEIKHATTGRSARLTLKAAAAGPDSDAAATFIDLDFTNERCTREFIESNWAPWLDTARELSTGLHHLPAGVMYGRRGVVATSDNGELVRDFGMPGQDLR